MEWRVKKPDSEAQRRCSNWHNDPHNLPAGEEAQQIRQPPQPPHEDESCGLSALFIVGFIHRLCAPPCADALPSALRPHRSLASRAASLNLSAWLFGSGTALSPFDKRWKTAPARPRYRRHAGWEGDLHNPLIHGEAIQLLIRTRLSSSRRDRTEGPGASSIARCILFEQCNIGHLCTYCEASTKTHCPSTRHTASFQRRPCPPASTRTVVDCDLRIWVFAVSASAASGVISLSASPTFA